MKTNNLPLGRAGSSRPSPGEPPGWFRGLARLRSHTRLPPSHTPACRSRVLTRFGERRSEPDLGQRMTLRSDAWTGRLWGHSEGSG